LRAEADIPILLFVSSTKKESFLLAAYEAGIDEYMVKPISTSLFHAKINAWLRRASSLSIVMLDPLKVAGIQLDPSNRSLDIGEQGRIHLTILEVRLMYALMSTPGRTVSIDELCKQVWEKNRLGDATTLKNVVYRLRRKIEANPSNPKVIRTVVGVGYQFVSS
jgi:two-component system KDP operon response regulator KdpE